MLSSVTEKVVLIEHLKQVWSEFKATRDKLRKYHVKVEARSSVWTWAGDTADICEITENA